MITTPMSFTGSEPLPIEVDAERTLTIAGRHIHFVGIGGCGMSGLARIVQSLGGICTGTDGSASPITDMLTRTGIPVAIRQASDTVPAQCDLLVASAAVKTDHPEVVEARRRRIPVMKYAQLLGRLMLGRIGVAISGTHGKSTTTAMLAHVLIQTGQDPTFIVGATCQQIGGGSRTGRRDMLIAEACEYDRSFHNFHPTHAVILNVEEDHLDIYSGLEDIIESFRTFAQRIDTGGTLLIGHDNAQRTAVTAGLKCAVETIGFAPAADWQVVIERQSSGPVVSLKHDGQTVCRFASPMPGDHMAYNACVAAVLAHRMGAPWDGIGHALASFAGLDRRMQVIGTTPSGITVVDDYGHHPTEIEATLRALRAHHRPQSRGGRLICVFQPHQHSRTRFLMDQFATSFSQADAVIVPPIYFVRDSEADRRAVSAADLVQRLVAQGIDARHIETFEQIVEHLRKEARPNDLVVVMGAGPVWQVGKAFLEA
jgi:UDP-N-acetylmuramate--alanine ligase